MKKLLLCIYEKAIIMYIIIIMYIQDYLKDYLNLHLFGFLDKFIVKIINCLLVWVLKVYIMFFD